ncbi:hypothetical protein MHBO_002692 [Bonamia ostreae]|uniref:Uncharacterized protein n=1 Tax=Bonamia ostreae TaxID=126728 RepID=A0ABV2AN65_9EUKA
MISELLKLENLEHNADLEIWSFVQNSLSSIFYSIEQNALSLNKARELLPILNKFALKNVFSTTVENGDVNRIRNALVNNENMLNDFKMVDFEDGTKEMKLKFNSLRESTPFCVFKDNFLTVKYHGGNKTSDGLDLPLTINSTFPITDGTDIEMKIEEMSHPNSLIGLGIRPMKTMTDNKQPLGFSPGSFAFYGAGPVSEFDYVPKKPLNFESINIGDFYDVYAPWHIKKWLRGQIADKTENMFKIRFTDLPSKNDIWSNFVKGKIQPFGTRNLISLPGNYCLKKTDFKFGRGDTVGMLIKNEKLFFRVNSEPFFKAFELPSIAENIRKHNFVIACALSPGIKVGFNFGQKSFEFSEMEPKTVNQTTTGLKF